MLPAFYQNCFQKLLTPTQYKMLQILVVLLQFHKTVTLEKLATVLPQPILFESRRRSIQRFLLRELILYYVKNRGHTSGKRGSLTNG